MEEDTGPDQTSSICDDHRSRITGVLDSPDPIASSPETGEIYSDSEKNDVKSTASVSREGTSKVEIVLDKVSDISGDSADTVGYLHPKKRRKSKHKYKIKRRKKKKSKQDHKKYHENSEHGSIYDKAKLESSPKSSKKYKKMRKRDKRRRRHSPSSSPMILQKNLKMKYPLKNE